MKRLLLATKPLFARATASSRALLPFQHQSDDKLLSLWFSTSSNRCNSLSSTALVAHTKRNALVSSRILFSGSFYQQPIHRKISNSTGRGRRQSDLWPTTSSILFHSKHNDNNTNRNTIRRNQTAPTAITSLDSKWRTMTEGILELPVGTLNQGRWNEAITILTHWFGASDDASISRRTASSKDAVAIEQCWKILDRLCAELESTPENARQGKPILSAVQVVNPILLLWRNDFLEYHRSSADADDTTTSDRVSPPRLPSQLAKLLRNYQAHNLMELDSASHAILLDAAGKYSAILSRSITGGERINEDTHAVLLRNESVTGDSENRHGEGVLFADRYLKDWIQDYQKLHSSRKKGTNKTNKNVPPRPDIVAFGTLVHAWVESGLKEAPKKAEALVKTLDDLEGWKPNTPQSTKGKLDTGTGETDSRRKLYTSVLLAWARVGNPAKAKEWIDRMIREEEYPDVQTFNRLLMAYQSAAIKAKDASSTKNNYAQRAEEVLRHMQKLYHEPTGFLSEPPNVVSYNLVIDAWTKRAGMESASFRSGKRKQTAALDAARRAHGWFDQMKNAGIPPNTITYNTVITAYSRAGYPQESEKLLQEMIAVYQNSQEHGDDPSPTSHQNRQEEHTDAFDKYTSMTTTKPDVQSFTSVLAGWARVGTLEAAERAEELLNAMKLLGVVPNVETYGSCIHCWARVAGGKGKTRDQRNRVVMRAEDLFREMKEDQNISPDVYAYTGLLNVYGRSGRSRTAHEFLEVCLAEYNRTKDPRMKPTVVTFTAILNAWSKATNAPEASEKAHELLHRMKDEFGIEPNAFSYSSVLDAYSRSDDPEASTKALLLFRDMREVKGLEPNAYTCSNVLKAMARGGKVEEAEALLLELVYDTGVRVKLGPHAFSSVLFGWSKSKRRDAPERAERLVVEMQELYQRQMIDGPPNSVCWNNVLACWAHSEVPGAAQRAEDLLRKILEEHQSLEEESTKRSRNRSRHPSIQCNLIMYNTVMNAWANSGNFTKANDLYLELLEQHQLDERCSPPDDWTYRALWKSIVKSRHMTLEEKLSNLQTLVQSITEAGFKLNKNMKTDLERFTNQCKK